MGCDEAPQVSCAWPLALTHLRTKTFLGLARFHIVLLLVPTQPTHLCLLIFLWKFSRSFSLPRSLPPISKASRLAFLLPVITLASSGRFSSCRWVYVVVDAAPCVWKAPLCVISLCSCPQSRCDESRWLYFPLVGLQLRCHSGHNVLSFSWMSESWLSQLVENKYLHLIDILKTNF